MAATMILCLSLRERFELQILPMHVIQRFPGYGFTDLDVGDTLDCCTFNSFERIISTVDTRLNVPHFVALGLNS